MLNIKRAAKFFVQMKFFAAFILLISSSLYAEGYTLPYLGFFVPDKKPVSVELDWDASWFLSQNPFEYNHDIARMCCYFSGSSYNNLQLYHEGVPTAPESLLESLITLGFQPDDIEIIYDDVYPAFGQESKRSGIVLASQRIKNTDKYIIVCIIRGSPFSVEEWLSNIDIADPANPDEYYGAAVSRNYCMDCILNYFFKKKIPFSSANLLITGHSRGAAVANLIAARCADDSVFDNTRVFCYTFGTPNVICSKINEPEKYNFIFNVENAEDIVQYFPPDRGAWHYKKYGVTKILHNRWTLDDDAYDEKFSRMNDYFLKFWHRDCCLFRRGPFVPSVLVDVSLDLCKDSAEYNNAVFGMRRHFKRFLIRFFKKQAKPRRPKNNKNNVLKRLSNRVTSKDLEYLKNLFMDMHCAECYLSWMLAFDEAELFSTQGYTGYIIKGNADAVILNDKNKVCGKITAGYAEMNTFRVPEAMCSVPGKTFVGFPPAENYKIVLKSRSLFPSFLTIYTDTFDYKGSLENRSVQDFYMYNGKTIVLNAGNSSSSRNPFDSYYRRKPSQFYNADLFDFNRRFRLAPEVSFNTRGNAEFGFNFGIPYFYGKIMYSPNYFTGCVSAVPSCAIGSEQNIMWRIYVMEELVSRFCFPLWSGASKYDDFINIPSARLGFAIRPAKHFEIFALSEFNFSIDGYNDDAFKTGIRNWDIGHFPIGDYVDVYPDIRIGLRF